MPLMNDNIKMISCSDFRLFLKKLIIDKIEKENTDVFFEYEPYESGNWFDGNGIAPNK